MFSFLSALAEIGPFRHEVELPDGRKPDFELLLGDEENPIRLLGDITTVSDNGLDEQNPVHAFSDEITRLAKKHGLNPNHFRCDVKGGRVGPRIKLFLPKRNDFLRVVKESIEPFIQDLCRSGTSSGSYMHDAEGTCFTVGYDQSQMFAGGGYPSYDIAVSLTKNPLFNTLKSKAQQLRGVPQGVIRLVILCDAGCGTMRRSSLMWAPGTYSSREIAQDFLRQNSSIDLILLVTVAEETDWSTRKRVLTMNYELVAAPSGAMLTRITSANLHLVKAAVQRAVNLIPSPVLQPYNAVLQCEKKGVGPDMIGGYVVNGNTVKISARALHRLLAGELTAEEFIAAHEWGTEESTIHSNPFLRFLRSGRMIEAIKVEDGGDKDDDWLEFQFGAPDAAAAPFIVRSSSVSNGVPLKDRTPSEVPGKNG